MHSALSRRALLASPLALSAYAATPADISAPPAGISAPPAVSDELKWMIDIYEEIRRQRSLLQEEMARIDLPEHSSVALREVVSRPLDYPRHEAGVVFASEREIKSFFGSALRLSFGKGLGARCEADFEVALRLYRERKAAREAYLEASGFPALEERDDALFGKQFEIEGWIRAYTCRSLADVIAVAAFAETWLADDGTDMEARSDLLRAISAFALVAEER